MLRRLAVLVAALALSAPAFASDLPAPDDPYVSFQWGLDRIRAQEAWTVTQGAGSIVAVIDTGVDANHPDLRGRVLRGYDFVDNDRDASDQNGHGTLIAGIIAATTFNGKGIASVAPQAKILPVRVLGSDGTGASPDVAKGIDWAVDHGADVINLSLAQESVQGGPLLPDDLLRDPSVDQAIRRAAARGATVVVAAGNEKNGGKPTTAYDAQVAGVVVVGASTRGDRRAAYSNYGTGLDVLAPGGGSATNAGDSGCKQDNSVVSTWWDPKTRASSYGGGCGTSMSVGFVSGLAAQLKARGMTNAQIVDRILLTADDIGSAGPDEQSGHGRVNAARALGARVTKPPISVRPSGDRRTVRAQGSSAPIERPSARTVEAAPPLAAPVIPIFPPAGSFPARRGWVVQLAAGMVCALVLAHAWRWVARNAVPR